MEKKNHGSSNINSGIGCLFLWVYIWFGLGVWSVMYPPESGISWLSQLLNQFIFVVFYPAFMGKWTAELICLTQSCGG